MNNILNAYHGTDSISAQKILNCGKIKCSNNDSVSVRNGVYCALNFDISYSYADVSSDFLKSFPVVFEIDIKSIKDKITCDEDAIKYYLDSKGKDFEYNFWKEKYEQNMVKGNYKKDPITNKYNFPLNHMGQIDLLLTEEIIGNIDSNKIIKETTVCDNIIVWNDIDISCIKSIFIDYNGKEKDFKNKEEFLKFLKERNLSL